MESGAAADAQVVLQRPSSLPHGEDTWPVLTFESWEHLAATQPKLQSVWEFNSGDVLAVQQLREVMGANEGVMVWARCFALNLDEETVFMFEEDGAVL